MTRKQIFNESHAYTGGVSYHFSPESEIGLKYEGKYSEGSTFSKDTLSMIPGVSRSMATIVGGMAQKLTRKKAAEFSFFLAVPTMFAATVLLV